MAGTIKNAQTRPQNPVVTPASAGKRGSGGNINNSGDVGRQYAAPDLSDLIATEVEAAASAAVADGSITTAKLAANAVDATKLADGAVSTAAKLAADVVETAKILDANVTTSKLAAGAVTKAKTAMFVSTEQTGTGAAQNIAHGLGAVPTAVFVAPTDLTPVTVGAYSVVEGAHDGTNVVLTVTTGKKYKVMSWL